VHPPLPTVPFQGPAAPAWFFWVGFWWGTVLSAPAGLAQGVLVALGARRRVAPAWLAATALGTGLGAASAMGLPVLLYGRYMWERGLLGGQEDLPRWLVDAPVQGALWGVGLGLAQWIVLRRLAGARCWWWAPLSAGSCAAAFALIRLHQVPSAWWALACAAVYGLGSGAGAAWLRR
jgi:hypothetical protein